MSKCKHNRLNMGYVEARLYADKQLSKGIRQKQCPVCKLWLWPCEIVAKKPKYKRVKAWAHPDIVTTENPMVWVAKNKSPVYSVPCTILINEKHFRNEKV